MELYLALALIHKRGVHAFDFVRDNQTGILILRMISGSDLNDTLEFTANEASIFAALNITYQFSAVDGTSSGAFVFETIPVDIDSDIYFESSETFLIQNGLHKGNQQDQLQNTPAISLLDFHDCYSFGNGVESYQKIRRPYWRRQSGYRAKNNCCI